MRKILLYYKSFKYRFNGLLVKIFLQLSGCRVGKNLKCLSIPRFRVLPRKNIVIGDNVTIGENIVFEIVAPGELIIGDRVNLTRNIVICANKKIHIGNDVLIAENVSIRDAEHRTEKNSIIWKQQNKTGEIIIGNDVWIGAMSMILLNTEIANGVVLGAYSMVKNRQLTAYGIYAGNPVKKIKERT